MAEKIGENPRLKENDENPKEKNKGIPSRKETTPNIDLAKELEKVENNFIKYYEELSEEKLDINSLDIKKSKIIQGGYIVNINKKDSNFPDYIISSDGMIIFGLVNLSRQPNFNKIAKEIGFEEKKAGKNYITTINGKEISIEKAYLLINDRLNYKGKLDKKTKIITEFKYNKRKLQELGGEGFLAPDVMKVIRDIDPIKDKERYEKFNEIYKLIIRQSQLNEEYSKLKNNSN